MLGSHFVRGRFVFAVCGECFFPLCGGFFLCYFFFVLCGVSFVSGVAMFFRVIHNQFFKNRCRHTFCNLRPLFLLCVGVFGLCARVFVSVFFWGGGKVWRLWQSKAGVYVSKDVLCYVSVWCVVCVSCRAWDKMAFSSMRIGESYSDAAHYIYYVSMYIHTLIHTCMHTYTYVYTYIHT